MATQTEIDRLRRTRGGTYGRDEYDDPTTASRWYPNRSYPGGTGDPNSPGGTGTPPPTPTPPPPPPPETKPVDPWKGRADAGTYTAATDQSTWDSDEYAKPAWTPTRYATNPVSGYDAAKWASATHQTPKYVVGRILSGYDLNDPAQLQLAMADLQRAYPGTTWAGKDIVNIPGHGDVDIIRDFGGESGIAWDPLAFRTAAPAGAPGAAGTGAAGLTSATAQPMGVGSDMFSSSLPASQAQSAIAAFLAQQGLQGTTSTTTASSGSPQDAELNAARRAALLEMLNQKPPTPDELRNTPENQAYQLQAQRAEERDRAMLAERAGAEGFDNSGYFDTQLGGLAQARGEGEAGFLGQLAVTRMAQQRDELKFAVQQAQQSEQFDLAQQLDRQRMVLDAAINQEQLAIDQRRLAESQRQFNNRLGYDYAGLQLDANRDAAIYGSDLR